jgi:hydroxymethylglutaryl-CoA lyase
VSASLLRQLAGTAAALAAGAHKLALPLSTSETQSLKNLRRNHAHVLDEVRVVAAMVKALPAGTRQHFEGSVSTTFGCPIEGVVSEARVVALAEALIAAGCEEVGLGLANVVAGLEVGITTFGASLGGLGGCPFAPGAGGDGTSDGDRSRSPAQGARRAARGVAG